jgi:XRE family transcriptional regulator, regulator of sulfur utilization
MTLKHMAIRVKRLREARGLTQEALAKRAGLSRGYLARLETARQDPRLSVVAKLARALRVKASELID